MMSVVRFLKSPDTSIDDDEERFFEGLRDAVNLCWPDADASLRVLRNDGVSCMILEGGRWPEQMRSIRRFLADCRSVVERAVANGMSICIDLVVTRDDIGANVISLELCPADLRILADAGVSLELSVSCF